MINVWIDELTPCLKDTLTGDVVETEVIRLTRKSFLKKFNVRNQWFVNWDELLDKDEIYALVIKGTFDIQGLVALRKDEEVGAVYVNWMVAAPQNNKLLNDSIKFSGVGGHLFAIAIDKSIEYDCDGVIYGFAANKKLLDHYIERFHAEYIGRMHPFQFAIDEVNGKTILEVYTYEWSEEKL